MEKIFKIFDSHEAADRAEREDYASMRPQERLEILLELVRRYRQSVEDNRGTRLHGRRR